MGPNQIWNPPALTPLGFQPWEKFSVVLSSALWAPSFAPSDLPLFFCCCFVLWTVVYVCSWAVSSACFLTDHLGGRCPIASISSFHPVSVPFSPSCQYCCWSKILNNFVRVLSMSQGFTPLDKKLLHGSFLDNSFSIFGCCSDGWGDL